MNKKQSFNNPAAEPRTIQFGRILKFWRTVYKLSQEELAFRIGSASRHISRLEKGDAQPSKEMVLRIAEAFPLGNRDTINFLLFAGYTDHSHKMDLFSPEFDYRREEVIVGLKALDPNPALVIDMTGQILMVNRAWAGFQRHLDPEDEMRGVPNIFDFLFNYADKNALPQEWGGTLAALLLSLQQWIYFYGDENNKVAALLERLKASPYLPREWERYAAERLAGKKFKVNVLIEGVAQSFLIHCYIENLLGPLAFSAIPELVVMTFFAEDETFDRSPFMGSDPKHPQLFY